MASFITVREGKQVLKTYGIDLTDTDDVAVARLTQEASDLVNGSFGDQFLYKSISDELHVLPGTQLATELFYRPIRKVSAVRVVIGARFGAEQSITVVTSPIEDTTLQPTWLQTEPDVYGDVFVDRTNNIVRVQIAYPYLSLYQFASFEGFQVMVAYTSGYDDGTVQADGMSFKAPDSLRQATKITLRHMVHLVQAEQQGINEAVTVTVGAVQERIASGFSWDLPDAARNLVTQALEEPLGMA